MHHGTRRAEAEVGVGAVEGANGYAFRTLNEP